MNGKDNRLTVKNLSISFQSGPSLVRAVKDLSFSLSAGETLGIVGESGSGKSVTALAIMRLLDDRRAQININSQVILRKENRETVNLLKASSKEMPRFRGKEIGMVFQEPMSSLNPVFRCGLQVTEAIRLHKSLSFQKAKSQALALFEQVQLPNPDRIFNAYPHELSGGQKQRVMIAMAISCEPRILIADEPTTALDVTVQKEILALLKQIKKDRQMSMILISHDLGVIAQVADRVMVMYRGEAVEQAEMAAIFRHPQHPYTQGLLNCRPPVDQALDRLPVVEDFFGEKDENSVVRKTLDPSALQERREGLYRQEPVLRVEGLSTWFAEKKNFWGKPRSFLKAVNEVNLEIYPGETVGLVGESGCGKTTLGRTILQLEKPHKGRVWYRGQNLIELAERGNRKWRKDLQIVFQDPFAALNPRMRIGEAIIEPMKVHLSERSARERKKKAHALLEAVGLEPNHFGRYPHEFSGGQRQRICIARALAVDPAFLIFDEAVSALDVSVQAVILNLLKDLRESFGFTSLFISHDLSVVRFISDRVAVMKEGRILELDWPEQIYQHPKDPYTRQLIQAVLP